MSGGVNELVVDRLRVTVLSAPISDAVPMSFAQLDNRQVCLVEVSADGVTGVGESWVNYPAWGPVERVATLCEGVAPLLLGMNVSDPPAALRILAQRLLPVARQWGAPGPVWQAISGIDLAVWDLIGKARGAPVAQLLRDGAGGTLPQPCAPAYASGVGPTDVERLCEMSLQAGLGAVKVKLGFGEERDRATLRAARSTLGDDHLLFADANQAWNLDTATELCRTLAEYGVAWLEEPLDGDDLADLEKLAAATSLTLATGENLYGLDTFKRYSDSAAVGIIQPDLAKSGGLTVASQVARHAASSGTAVAPHCYSSALGLAASLHFSAAFDVVDWIELDVRDNPLRTDLLTEPLRMHGASPVLPSGPGLGVQLDPDAIARFQTHVEERTHHDR